MEPFTVLTGVAAPLFRPDINTDAIIPMKWLVTATRTGLGKGLFYGWRYLPGGGENADFVLNQPAFRGARILVAGPNFGCGSSREHAAWAFLDFGIRCIVAPGFASIFYENCLKNGILPIVLPAGDVEDLARWAQQAGPDAKLTVDLVRSTVTGPAGREHAFQMDSSRRAALLAGRDEIDETLARERAIAAFQSRDREVRPWVYRTGVASS